MRETKRVAIFASVSSKEQAKVEKDSLPGQIRDGKAWAEERGWEVVATYEVDGHSRKYYFYEEAARQMEAYRRLREDAEAQGFDVLWCRARDRLGRTDALIAQVEAVVMEIGDAQVYSALIPTPVEGASKVSALYTASMERVQAQVGNIQRTQNISNGVRARVRRGLHPNTWPHGYEAVRDEKGNSIGGEFVPGEIEAVKLATKLFLEGKGYHTIVKMLNESPWKPRQAKRWGYSVVQGMMNNDTYAGLVSYDDVETTEPSGYFPALWDEETYAAILRERKRRKRGGSAPVSPVSGIVFCNRCGWAMAAAKSSSGTRYFRCSKHRHRGRGKCHNNATRESVIITKLEKSLMGLKRAGALDEALARALPNTSALEAERDQAQARVDEIEAKQWRLAVAVADDIIDREAAKNVNDQLAGMLNIAESALKQAKDRLITLPDQEEQRRVLEELISKEVDLCAEPIETMRAKLRRAGVKVLVENRKIVKILFGSS